jgi:hypothetical protein
VDFPRRLRTASRGSAWLSRIKLRFSPNREIDFATCASIALDPMGREFRVTAAAVRTRGAGQSLPEDTVSIVVDAKLLDNHFAQFPFAVRNL